MNKNKERKREKEWKCFSCGNSFSNNLIHCPICQISRAKAKAMEFCFVCGTRVINQENRDFYCPKCQLRRKESIYLQKQKDSAIQNQSCTTER